MVLHAILQFFLFPAAAKFARNAHVADIGWTLRNIHSNPHANDLNR
jgi:hypothetical protein